MKLSRLDIDTVVKAVSAYLDLAYGVGVKARRMPDLSLPRDAGPEQVLGLFQREESVDSGRGAVSYTFRLGNRNYPFMKLSLQEHLVAGEYYFAVDTHDQMEVKPDYPDYEAWQAVKRFNQQLKRQIEARLLEEGLDTAASLARLLPDQAADPGSDARRILVVDDEEDLGRAVEAALRAFGYRVTRVEDGDEGVRLAKLALPDLVVLDYELPGMDGLQVIAALRADATTRGIPVLLTTAGRIKLEDIERADGFLAKPYPKELLYQVVQRLLAGRRVEGRGVRP